MKNEKFEAMQNAAKAFKGCFDENQLFIPEATDDKFAPLYNLLMEKAIRFSAEGYNWSPQDARTDPKLFSDVLKRLQWECRSILAITIKLKLNNKLLPPQTRLKSNSQKSPPAISSAPKQGR